MEITKALVRGMVSSCAAIANESLDVVVCDDRQSEQIKRKQGSLRFARPAYDKPVRCGRNDPCVCGSGKKFKQCCWSNK